MIYQGCNMSQLSTIFKVDHRVLAEKMYGIAPCGTRNGTNIWHIRDVAPALWKPNAEQVEKHLKTMNHADLPKMLTKEFWAGQRSRQEFETRNRDLWPTVEIVEAVGELFKLIKMNLLLAPDSIEREVELSDPQRKIFKRVVDGTLKDIHRMIVKKFETKEPAQPAPSAPEEDDDL
jgi:hypothetical protein